MVSGMHMSNILSVFCVLTFPEIELEPVPMHGSTLILNSHISVPYKNTTMLRALFCELYIWLT